MSIPKKMNLGSGKQFRKDCLNIDINPYWQPDIILDISSDFITDGKTFTSTRFGDIALHADGFDEITAHDVLEHIPDLVGAMTNCLRLLRVGGIFNIIVPYDLSYGAWQDPTHVRAFNERSWLYYTDWFWYLGWQTHRFKVTGLDFALSPSGKAMLTAGADRDIIIRTPRAVDSMKVTLEKIPLSEQDRQALEKWNASQRMALA